MPINSELDELHASYVGAINYAVGSDNLALVESLADEYGAEALRLVAERDGTTHLLPRQHRRAVDSRFGRLVTRLRQTPAA
ncbi:hypothetical protein BH09ACT12_BH09ACT12_17870 [soil metagenome]